MGGRRDAVPGEAFGIAIRRGLDIVYVTTAGLGGLCLVAIFCMVMVQVAGRWLSIPIAGLSELSTYAMAASLFLPLGYAFKAGAHIRVTVLLERLPKEHHWIAQLWCLGVAFGLSAHLAWSSLLMTKISFSIRDISPGADATPLWIPQSAMAIGTTVLALAVLDELIGHLLARRPAEPWQSATAIQLKPE